MKYLITKEMIALLQRQGWKIEVKVEKKSDVRGRFLQTGSVKANFKDKEFRISNECFINTIVIPAQIDAQIQAINEKLNNGIEISNLERAFYMSNKNKANNEKRSYKTK